jgi:hypothetical protein
MAYLMERWATWDGIHTQTVGEYESPEAAQAEAETRNSNSRIYRTSVFFVGDGTNHYESLGPVTRTSYGQ